jgi:hypothetical protein
MVPEDPLAVPEADVEDEFSDAPAAVAVAEEAPAEAPRRRSILRRLTGAPLRVFGIAAATAAAVYLGLTLGQSNSAGALACGAPLTVEQGAEFTLQFDSPSLAGYSLTGVVVQPISLEANTALLSAQPDSGLVLQGQAGVAEVTAERVDEYRLHVDFARGSERLRSDCTVLVHLAPPR